MTLKTPLLAVPLATLVNATKAPRPKSKAAILSPEGKKRHFVVHGGLFSKDDVTLDDVRKVQRIGHQPGQEGLMCALLFILHLFAPVILIGTHAYRTSYPIQARYVMPESFTNNSPNTRFSLRFGNSYCGRTPRNSQVADRANV